MLICLQSTPHPTKPLGSPLIAIRTQLLSSARPTKDPGGVETTQAFWIFFGHEGTAVKFKGTQKQI